MGNQSIFGAFLAYLFNVLLLFSVLMGTECIGARLDDSDIIPSVPPGFGSLATFTLQRVQENVWAPVCISNSPQAPSTLSTPMAAEDSINDEGRLKKSLRHRPWVNYSQFDNSSDEEEAASELIEPVSTNLKLSYWFIFVIAMVTLLP